jgi:hypothetical protein
MWLSASGPRPCGGPHPEINQSLNPNLSTFHEISRRLPTAAPRYRQRAPFPLVLIGALLPLVGVVT